jgi:hypothetical protein
MGFLRFTRKFNMFCHLYRADRGSAKRGIPAKSYATVEVVDREQNLLTVRTQDQRVHTYRPTQLRGVEVFRAEPREFAVGERVQFRAPFKDQQIANGALGRIEKIETQRGVATLRMDNGKTFSVPWDALRHIDYGYTTTSHSSQGMTVDRVLVQIDTDRSAQLVNRQQFYVSISRARIDVQVFTNHVERLPAVVARALVKTTAIEAREGHERQAGQRAHRVTSRDRTTQRRAEAPVVRPEGWRSPVVAARGQIAQTKEAKTPRAVSHRQQTAPGLSPPPERRPDFGHSR